MDLALTQSLGLSLLSPQSLIAVSQGGGGVTWCNLTVSPTSFTSCWTDVQAPSPLGWEPPESCLSLAATPVSPPEPFALPAILAPFKDAFDSTLSCALPPHSCQNLTFKTMVDLVKIDAPMYPLSELEDKVLGV
ncbi:hypothetical protein DSO57_1031364 [Entomophthora muscae]|uniref:Uncharacterized protein n=1 Tax=Entomophthora muscae TaxID=34485 RepID=A0ACC2SDK9_9FUNG|nr:hypothetical protein DSO57_1031364 [Entomophthora muscae]